MGNIQKKLIGGPSRGSFIGLHQPDSMPEEPRKVFPTEKLMEWARCPHCRYYVELVSGCNDVSCRCGTTFCCRCGRKAKRCRCSGYDSA